MKKTYSVKGGFLWLNQLSFFYCLLIGFSFLVFGACNKDAIPLGRTDLTWFYEKYTPVASEGDDPRISLVDKANLSLMPPTTIIAAEIDPLQTEGKQLADNMTIAGITVDYKLYTGVTHEFFGMNTVLPEAKAAEDYAASRLKNALK